MKYVSIDVETTGLDEDEGQTLQIGMVFEDTNKNLPIEELPYLDLYIEQDRVSFEKGALKMHAETGFIKRWLNIKRVKLKKVTKEVYDWLKK